ncbi:MAG: exodeoxyribonuclease VII small subunit [Clostridia bacterium]|nr:exodeoxyribonuclease VII small subunit [Clostridia bacterium]
MSKLQEEKTFEGALTRLEEIVRLLETGDGTLESSISSFEEGISLVRFCSEKLEKAEQRVKILLDGGKREEDFTSEDSETAES